MSITKETTSVSSDFFTRTEIVVDLDESDVPRAPLTYEEVTLSAVLTDVKCQENECRKGY